MTSVTCVHSDCQRPDHGQPVGSEACRYGCEWWCLWVVQGVYLLTFSPSLEPYINSKPLIQRQEDDMYNCKVLLRIHKTWIFVVAFLKSTSICMWSVMFFSVAWWAFLNQGRADWITYLREAQQVKARTRLCFLGLQIEWPVHWLPVLFPHGLLVVLLGFSPGSFHVPDILAFNRYEVDTGHGH